MKKDVIRKTDDLVRIVLSIEARRAVGAQDGDDFKIEVISNTTIALTVVKPQSCIQCHTTKNLIHTDFGDICETCLFKPLRQFFHDKLNCDMDDLQAKLFSKTENPAAKTPNMTDA